MQKIDSVPALIYDTCIKETWIIFCVFRPFALTVTYYCVLALRITTQLNFGQLFIYLDRDADKYHLTQRKVQYFFSCVLDFVSTGISFTHLRLSKLSCVLFYSSYTSSPRSLFPSPILVPIHLGQHQTQTVFCKWLYNKSNRSLNSVC